jgi:NifB/MoaA-like Fe-S oxidoreductase
VCALDDRALERFDELLEAGIDLHVQIVLVPGVNDGDVLDETLRWLAEREGVASVGIVPLGYTRYQEVFTASFQAPEAARDVIERVSPWQEACRAEYGTTWVQLADELYLNAGADVPPAEHYDGYPQYENGIGMVRAFLDEWEEAVRRTGLEHGGSPGCGPGVLAAETPRTQDPAAGAPNPAGPTLVTGTLFAPVLKPLAEALGALVLAVENAFFGGDVSVTGLLTGEDIVRAIVAHRSAGPFLVPDVVANEDGLLLDDIPADELGKRTRRNVRLVSCDAASLVSELRGLSADIHPKGR